MKIPQAIFAITLFLSSIVFSQECEWCKRRAILSECNNKVVEGSGLMYPSSVMARTYQAVSPPCFYWLATHEALKQFENLPEKEILEYNLKHGKPPEYIFKTLFESGLSGLKRPMKVILTDDTTDYYNVTSRFTMELYYNGETEEFIDKWVTLGTQNDVSYHYRAMWENKDAEMKTKSPLDVMYKFEQIPTECSVIPEKETIAINDSMEIEVSDFKGFYGGKPKSFNRIIVHAFHGMITNGAKCDIGPDYKVFTLDNENIKVKYRAPGECDITDDRITIFNSCDILPKSKWPLDKTEMKEQIAEKKINISCWDATLILKKQVTKEIVNKKSKENVKGNCKQRIKEQYKLNETIDASVFVALELEYSIDMPVFNQTFEYYKPVSVNLSSFNYVSKDSKIMTGDNSGMGCANTGYETKDEKQRTLNNRKIQGKGSATQARWILVIDNKTKKALKIIPAGYGIDYKITETESIHTSVWGDKGTKNHSKTNTKTAEKTFKLGPVADPITDPTVKSSNKWVKDYLERQGVKLPEGVQIPKQENSDVKKDIPPDILVKFGDGETNFGGEGSKLINKPNENGYEKEDLHYLWQMTRKKKNK